MPLPVERRNKTFAGPTSLTNTENVGSAITPGTGVTAQDQPTSMIRHIQLTLAAFSVAITAANDYGGTKLLDLPDSNLVLLGAEADLEMVKGEVTNGLEDTTDVTVAMGTAVASNATLSGAMVDVLTGIAYTATDASPAHQIHSHADASLTYPILLSDSATLAVFFNASALITASDALTISGTVDLYFLDVGNITS